MSVIVGEGRVIAQRVTRSITYYCTSRTPGGDSPSPSPSTISPTSSHLDAPFPSPSYSLSTPLLPDSHHNVSSILTHSTLDIPSLSPSSPSSHRPLLLLFPWLGARPGAMAKYRDFYLERGLDILSVESIVWHFLWPRWGREYAAEVLELLDDPRFKGRTLLVHAFSIGGYTFCQLLSQMVREPHKYPGLAQRVVGHVYDSLVIGSLEQMATGLGKTLFPRIEPLVRYIAMLYFWLFKSQTVHYYDNLVQVFYNSPVTAPAVFFFCENDVLCDLVAMEAVLDFWRKRGVSVETRKWKESVHAAHLRCHPEEYLSTLETFFHSLNIAPLRAKM
uniref:Si:dkey-5i3.5 n=1 Tax=Hucho hucho TaxID=62062 RepID=A0A4W5MRN3_9TELE